MSAARPEGDQIAMTEKQATQKEFEAKVATHAAYRRGEATWEDVVASRKAYDAAWMAWYATQPPIAYTEADAWSMGYGQNKYQGD